MLFLLFFLAVAIEPNEVVTPIVSKTALTGKVDLPIVTINSQNEVGITLEVSNDPKVITRIEIKISDGQKTISLCRARSVGDSKIPVGMLVKIRCGRVDLKSAKEMQASLDITGTLDTEVDAVLK